jgi:hypothetical protein
MARMTQRWLPLLILCLVWMCDSGEANAQYYGQSVPDLDAVSRGEAEIGPSDSDIFENVHRQYERVQDQWAREDAARDNADEFGFREGEYGTIEDRDDAEPLDPSELSKDELYELEHDGLPPPDAYNNQPVEEELPDKQPTPSPTPEDDFNMPEVPDEGGGNSAGEDWGNEYDGDDGDWGGDDSREYDA